MDDGFWVFGYGSLMWAPEFPVAESVIAQADGGRYAGRADPEAAVGALEQISATGRQALADMRSLLGVLREGDAQEFAPQHDVAAIGALVERGGPLVAILWGRDARGLVPHLPGVACIESPHPSPLSARHGFFGSRPFSRANELLARQGADPVDWRLP